MSEYLSITFRGLDIEGTVDHCPGDYMTPPTCDVDIKRIRVGDSDDFHGYDLLSDTDLSSGAITMIQAWDGMNKEGKLHPIVEKLVLDRWTDDIEEALIEKGD